MDSINTSIASAIECGYPEIGEVISLKRYELPRIIVQGTLSIFISRELIYATNTKADLMFIAALLEYWKYLSTICGKKEIGEYISDSPSSLAELDRIGLNNEGEISDIDGIKINTETEKININLIKIYILLKPTLN